MCMAACAVKAVVQGKLCVSEANPQTVSAATPTLLGLKAGEGRTSELAVLHPEPHHTPVQYALHQSSAVTFLSGNDTCEKDDLEVRQTTIIEQVSRVQDSAHL